MHPPFAKQTSKNIARHLSTNEQGRLNVLAQAMRCARNASDATDASPNALGKDKRGKAR